MIADMKYEAAKPNSKPSNVAIKKAENRDLDKLSTSKLLWHLVARHKVFLIAAWAIWVTVIHYLPTMPGLVMDLFQSAF